MGSDAYRALIDSDRVSTGTRKILLARAQLDHPGYVPMALSSPAFDILRAVLDRVVPQSDEIPIDLAARLDSQLAAGVGDGWRRAELPPDKVAYQRGLRTLADDARLLYGDEFLRLDDQRQDELLQRTAAGLPPPADDQALVGERFDARQMQLWFDDVRADAVRLFVAHPRTLSRMGYSGFANGGDGQPKSGFSRVGVAEREAWEPVAPASVKL